MYDIYSPTSIESFAKKLISKSFRDFLPDDFKEYRGKGGLGQLVEKYYFGYEPNSDKDPDFKEAGVELKVTPYKRIKKTKNNNIPFSAKERLVLNVINFEEIINEVFPTSSFLYKNSLILMIFYLHNVDIEDKLDFIIKYVQLFQYPVEDLHIIEQDWNKIVNKIRAGKAHEISEGDTLYLGACTKGSTKEESYRIQPCSDIKAPQRAFSLKSSYMTHILRNYILQNKTTYEPIIKDTSLLKNQSFEGFVVNKISEYYGKNIEYLCEHFNINPVAKDKTTKIALRILGLRSNSAEEFEKANIKLKAIRINYNGKIKEHMSFPTFKFKEIVFEDWETSNFRTMLEGTKFFFVIYRFDKHGNLILEKSMFWNMPINILDTEVKSVWNKTVEIIKEGVKFSKKANKNYNNLPSPSENPVSHVRPHAKNSNDTYPLPDGRQMTKQCFWLDRNFILQQINLSDWGSN